MAQRGEELLGTTIALAPARPRAALEEIEGSADPRRRRPDEARVRAGRDRARTGSRSRPTSFAAGRPLRAREPRHARPALHDRGHRGDRRAPRRRCSAARSSAIAARHAGRRRRARCGAVEPEVGIIAARGVLRPAGDRAGDARGRTDRSRDGRSLPAGHPGDRPRRGRARPAPRGAPRGRRRREPGSRTAPIRRSRRSRSSRSPYVARRVTGSGARRRPRRCPDADACLSRKCRK